MRNFKYPLIAFLGIISFFSCSDDDFTFIAKQDPNGILFTNTTSEVYTLDAVNADNLAERFVWNSLDFGVQTPVSYELQGATSSSFDEIDPISNGKETNAAVTIKNMLALAKDAGLDNDPDTEAPNSGDLFFRVRGYVGSNGGGNLVEQYSDTLTVRVMLPEGQELEIPKLYVVGNFLEDSGYGTNWTATDAVPLATSAIGNSDYEGFVYMNVNENKPLYKFLPTNESFDGDYGDTGEKEGDFSGKIEQEGEVNAGTPDGTTGYYLIKVDTEKLTYNLTKTNWGILGNATPTGWGSDTDMTYDPDTKIWSVTLDLTKQEAPDNGIKFRANDGWDINIGDKDADGTMEFGGDNIGIPEDGNYTITLDLSTPREYKYSITKN